MRKRRRRRTAAKVGEKCKAHQRAWMWQLARVRRNKLRVVNREWGCEQPVDYFIEL